MEFFSNPINNNLQTVVENNDTASNKAKQREVFQEQLLLLEYKQKLSDSKELKESIEHHAIKELIRQNPQASKNDIKSAKKQANYTIRKDIFVITKVIKRLTKKIESFQKKTGLIVIVMLAIFFNNIAQAQAIQIPLEAANWQPTKPIEYVPHYDWLSGLIEYYMMTFIVLTVILLMTCHKYMSWPVIIILSTILILLHWPLVIFLAFCYYKFIKANRRYQGYNEDAVTLPLNVTIADLFNIPSTQVKQMIQNKDMVTRPFTIGGYKLYDFFPQQSKVCSLMPPLLARLTREISFMRKHLQIFNPDDGQTFKILVTRALDECVKDWVKDKLMTQAMYNDYCSLDFNGFTLDEVATLYKHYSVYDIQTAKTFNKNVTYYAKTDVHIYTLLKSPILLSSLQKDAKDIVQHFSTCSKYFQNMVLLTHYYKDDIYVVDNYKWKGTMYAGTNGTKTGIVVQKTKDGSLQIVKPIHTVQSLPDGIDYYLQTTTYDRDFFIKYFNAHKITANVDKFITTIDLSTYPQVKSALDLRIKTDLSKITGEAEMKKIVLNKAPIIDIIESVDSQKANSHEPTTLSQTDTSNSEDKPKKPPKCCQLAEKYRYVQILGKNLTNNQIESKDVYTLSVAARIATIAFHATSHNHTFKTLQKDWLPNDFNSVIAENEVFAGLTFCNTGTDIVKGEIQKEAVQESIESFLLQSFKGVYAVDATSKIRSLTMLTCNRIGTESHINQIQQIARRIVEQKRTDALISVTESFAKKNIVTSVQQIPYNLTFTYVNGYLKKYSNDLHDMFELSTFIRTYLYILLCLVKYSSHILAILTPSFNGNPALFTLKGVIGLIAILYIYNLVKDKIKETTPMMCGKYVSPLINLCADYQLLPELIQYFTISKELAYIVYFYDLASYVVIFLSTRKIKRYEIHQLQKYIDSLKEFSSSIKEYPFIEEIFQKQISNAEKIKMIPSYFSTFLEYEQYEKDQNNALISLDDQIRRQGYKDWVDIPRKPIKDFEKEFAPELVKETTGDYIQKLQLNGCFTDTVQLRKWGEMLDRELYNDNIKYLYKPNPREASKPKFVQQKSIKSLLEALLSRHGGHLVGIEKQKWQKFEGFIKSYLDEKILEMKGKLEGSYSIQDYIDSRPSKKRAFYQRLFDNVDSFNPSKCTYDIMVKTMEQMYVADNKVKSRLIWNPPDLVKIYGGYFNWRLLSVLKATTPEFIHGCSMSSLEHKLNKKVVNIKNPIFIAADGSNHDSSQTFEWINAVDNYLIDNLWMDIINTTSTEVLYQESVYKALTSLYTYFQYIAASGERITGRVHGTVTSGAPTRTTLGNTLRMIILNEFIMSEAKIPKGSYAINIAGDDTLLIIDEMYLSQYYSTVGQYVYVGEVKEKITHGLGYNYKEILISKEITEFLSKTIIYDGQFYVCKKIDRFSATGNYTHKIDNLTPDEYNRMIQFTQVSEARGIPQLLAALAGEQDVKINDIIKKIAKKDDQLYFKLLQLQEESKLDRLENMDYYINQIPEAITNPKDLSTVQFQSTLGLEKVIKEWKP